jgi:hypothetical protein
MGGGGSSMRDINAIPTPYQTPKINNQNLIVNEEFKLRFSGGGGDLSGFFLLFIIIIIIVIVLLYYFG